MHFDHNLHNYIYNRTLGATRTNYIDIDMLKKEVEEAKKICTKNNWSTIDVTKKSIEEIAATALEYFKIFRDKKLKNEK